MALTLNQFVGFETQGLEEALATSGTPVVDGNSPVRTGIGSMKLETSTVKDEYDIDLFDQVADAGNDYICGFAINVDTISPSAAYDILTIDDNTGESLLHLSVNSSGDLELRNQPGTVVATVTDPFIVDTWHFIEVYWQDSATGDAELFIDGVSVASVTSDFFNSSLQLVAFFIAGGGVRVAIDDFYFLSGAASAVDRLGDAEVFMYQNTAEDATDQGDTLNNGTWALVSETPLNNGTANDAKYTVNAARSGHTLTDEGTRSGPNGDDNIDGDDSIKGAKFIWNLKRSNGSSTTFSVKYGNSGDGVSSTDVTLSTAYQNFFILSEAAAVVPLSTESFAIGVGKTSGNRDIFIGDQWAMLLHVPRPASGGEGSGGGLMITGVGR